MNKPAAAMAGIEETSVLLLASAAALVAVPHLANLPLDAPGFLLAMCAWRIGAVVRWAPLPGRGLLAALTVGGAALVYWHFRRFHGQDAAAALLLVGVGLKLLEMKSTRDLYLVVYLVIFVAVTNFLFSQSLWVAMHALVVVVLLLACLMGPNGALGWPLAARFRLAGTLLGQAIPVMVVLFLLVPRITGPLWRLPEADPAAGSGLGDSMEPGAISHLGLSREPAFRVDFRDDPPPPRERYWRGPVFWHFDGRRWTTGGEASEAVEQGASSEGRRYRYALTLEPHHRRWVFALDAPEVFPHELTRTSDGLLQARETVRERRRYELVSRIQATTPGPLSEAARQRALQLPGEPSVAIRELVDAWRAEAASDLELVERSLRHFHEQPFVYTLRPPSIAGDAVTGFLFQTRRGFCEHYAGAFVYLMRVAGVPARVVTGYQGGHWNPLGRFLEVQQADAHAWAEVWLERQGWLRIDPTAAVAPERIERESTFAAGTGLEGAVMFDSPAAQALGQRLSSLRGLVTEAGLLWASADHAWHNWVLDYGADRQTRLLARLGISDWGGVAQLLAGLLSGFGALLYLLLRRAEPGPDPALRAYRRVARKLERHGMIRRSAEGWSDFALRVAVTRPDLAAPLDGFTAVFLTIRYGRDWDASDLRRLERLAREFPSG